MTAPEIALACRSGRLPPSPCAARLVLVWALSPLAASRNSSGEGAFRRQELRETFERRFCQKGSFLRGVRPGAGNAWKPAKAT